jgi:hypothetical protein
VHAIITAAKQDFADGDAPLSAFAIEQHPQGLSLDDFDLSARFATGDYFGFRFGDRYCTGHFDREGNRLACSSRKTVGEVLRGHCDECAGKAYVPAALAVAFRGRPHVRLSSEPHVCYLAAYGGNLFKVGTARADRATRRLAEQGARAAVILKHCDDEAQALSVERAIRELGVPDRHSAIARLEALAQPADTEELLVALRLNAGTIRTRRPQLELERSVSLEQVRINQPTIRVRPSKMTQVREGVELRGIVSHVVGGLVLLEDNGCPRALTLRSLLGLEYWTLDEGEVRTQQLELFASAR